MKIKIIKILLLTVLLYLKPYQSSSYDQTQGVADSYDPVRVMSNITHSLQNVNYAPEASLRSLANAILEAETAMDRATAMEGYFALGQGHYLLGNFDDALLASNQAYLISTEIERVDMVQKSVGLLSKVHLAKDLKDETLDYLYKGLQLSEQLNDTASLGWYLIHIPCIELELGNLVRSMEYTLEARSLFEKSNDSIGLAYTHLTLGAIHISLGNHPSAGANLNKALGIALFHHDSLLVGRAYYQNATLLLDEGRVSEAETCLKRAQRFLEPTDSREYYRSVSLMGELLTESNKYSEAVKYLGRAKAHQIRDNAGLGKTYIRLGNVYLKQGDAASAEDAFSMGVSISSKSGLVNHARYAFKGLAQSQGMRGDYRRAFGSLNRYIVLTDSLYNLQKISEATKLEEQYLMRKHHAELQLRDAELERRKTRISQQQQVQLLLIIVILLFLVVLVLAYREYKQKRSANKLLAIQKDEIEKQKQIAEQRSKDFTDSLNYAKRIQQAILRASLQLREFFPQSFLFLIPRDIVSGDFYWVTKRNDRILFAIADCTGHGVPGAFMSIIGTYGLNRLVNEHNITNPAEILNRVNSLFENSLEQHEGAEIFDGMDIALCTYNPATKELSYAGANIPLYILREQGLPKASSQVAFSNPTHLLCQVNPVKQSIGSHFEKTPYVNHSIQLMDGDTIYLFTDGFSDQFGGDLGRKYRANELRKLLCSIGDKSLDEQKEHLLKSYYDWKGTNIQVDDVSFMGVRV